MVLSESVTRILLAYLKLVDNVTAGARLQQVWNALSAQQQSDISDILRPHYIVLFGSRRDISQLFALIGDCASVLTPVQRGQLLNLLKSDLADVFVAQKADIDAVASDISGGDF